MTDAVVLFDPDKIAIQFGRNPAAALKMLAAAVEASQARQS